MIRLLFVLLVSVAGFAALAAWVVRGGGDPAGGPVGPVRAALEAEARRLLPGGATAGPGRAPAPASPADAHAARSGAGANASAPAAAAADPVLPTDAAAEPPAVVEELLPRAPFARDRGEAPAAAPETPAPVIAAAEPAAAAPTEAIDLDGSAELIRRMLSVYRGDAEGR